MQARRLERASEPHSERFEGPDGAGHRWVGPKARRLSRSCVVVLRRGLASRSCVAVSGRGLPSRKRFTMASKPARHGGSGIVVLGGSPRSAASTMLVTLRRTKRGLACDACSPSKKQRSSAWVGIPRKRHCPHRRLHPRSRARDPLRRVASSGASLRPVRRFVRCVASSGASLRHIHGVATGAVRIGPCVRPGEAAFTLGAKTPVVSLRLAC
jgi:hypothetical protein